MKVERDLHWIRYFQDSVTFDKDKVGKWMYFFPKDFDALDYAAEVCEEAVQRGIVLSAKHTSDRDLFAPRGVACFYINGDDNEAHRRVIAYFLEKQLIPKTKKGKLYNISFKYDNQTRANQYGNDFAAEIQLSQFLDLDTGKWLPEKSSHSTQ